MRRLLGTPVGDYLPAAGLFCATVLYLVLAYRMKPIVRAFPAGVAWAMLGLIALDLIARTGTPAGAALTRALNPAADGPPPLPWRRQAASVLWLAGFAALLVLAGIIVAVPIYLFAALRLRGRRPILACALGAAGATLFLVALFWLLRIAPYPGLLFGGA